MRALLILLLATSAACGPSPRGLEWSVDFAAPADPACAARVEAEIRAGGCEVAEVVYAATVVPGAEAAPAPDALPPGPYGFYARAVDGAGDVYAESCENRVLPAAEGDSVVISVSCTTSDCACVPPVMDAGVDARDASDVGPDTSDGGPDTSIDTAPPPPPILLGAGALPAGAIVVPSDAVVLAAGYYDFEKQGGSSGHYGSAFDLDGVRIGRERHVRQTGAGNINTAGSTALAAAPAGTRNLVHQAPHDNHTPLGDGWGYALFDRSQVAYDRVATSGDNANAFVTVDERSIILIVGWSEDNRSTDAPGAQATTLMIDGVPCAETENQHNVSPEPVSATPVCLIGIDPGDHTLRVESDGNSVDAATIAYVMFPRSAAPQYDLGAPPVDEAMVSVPSVLIAVGSARFSGVPEGDTVGGVSINVGGLLCGATMSYGNPRQIGATCVQPVMPGTVPITVTARTKNNMELGLGLSWVLLPLP